MPLSAILSLRVDLSLLISSIFLYFATSFSFLIDVFPGSFVLVCSLFNNPITWDLMSSDDVALPLGAVSDWAISNADLPYELTKVGLAW